MKIRLSLFGPYFVLPIGRLADWPTNRTTPFFANMEGSDDEGTAFTMFSKKAKVTTAKSEVETKHLTMKKITSKPESERFKFDDLGLNEWVVRCVNQMGIVKPTPVQV